MTIQNAQKTVLFKESKISCKTVAQQIAKQAKERIENKEAYQNCGGDYGGEPAIASCKKSQLQSEKWKCTKCDNEAPCLLEIVFSDEKLPEHLKGRQRLTRNVCPCGEYPSADWQKA